MLLKVIVADDTYGIEVSEELVRDAEDFFAAMDRDMDNGWQMSRHWVEKPNKTQRCQIVADRLVQAIERDEKEVLMMMAGYVLSRMPGTRTIVADTTGDIMETELLGAPDNG